MERESVYRYEIQDAPGINVHRLRKERGWSLRELAERCHPALSHTTVARLEKNKGFTMDSLERVAAVLGVSPGTLWLPPDMFNYRFLTNEQRGRIHAFINDIANVNRNVLATTAYEAQS